LFKLNPEKDIYFQGKIVGICTHQVRIASERKAAISFLSYVLYWYQAPETI
jgi:hypothetical protein